MSRDAPFAYELCPKAKAAKVLVPVRRATRVTPRPDLRRPPTTIAGCVAELLALPHVCR